MLKAALLGCRVQQGDNAGLAQGKGRSGFNWWLVSPFLGPLATLLVVLRPRLETPAVQLLTELAVEDAEREAH